MGQSASKSVETGANRAPIYSPSVNNFHSFEEVEKSIESDEEKRLKVLVIGAGCAGLGAAWHLNRCKHVEVTLFESQSKLGGHANTITGIRHKNYVNDSNETVFVFAQWMVWMSIQALWCTTI